MQSALSQDIQTIFQEITRFKFTKLFNNIPKNKNYTDVVKYPICLNDIRKKIKSDKYESLDELNNDFQLLHHNTFLYYSENSRNTATAYIMYSMCNDLIEKVKNGINNISENNIIFDDLNPDILSATKEEIEKIIDLLKNQEITMQNILQFYRCSYQTFRAQVKNLGIEYPKLKAAKKKNSISERHIEFVEKVLKTWSVGYQTMCDYLELSEWETRQIYNELKPPKKEENKKENIHTKRFYATEINYVWHTDIHYLKNKYPLKNNETKYMIAFIDDCSRKILYYDIGDKKDQLFFINSLLKCIRISGSKPFILTTDNGGEFCGALSVTVLKLLEINHWRTKPYTPQQNGKIERFWRRLEKLTNYNDIESFVVSYNGIVSQRSLKKFAIKHLNINLLKKDATPDLIYENGKKFSEYHDGIIVEFDKKDDT